MAKNLMASKMGNSVASKVGNLDSIYKDDLWENSVV